MSASCEEIFGKFVPPAAVSYCCKLYNYFGFEFKIKKSRQTKFGDFRFNPETNKHTITINNDMNPYAFLVTYIHEVAHHVTYTEHGRKASPHGKEWKNNFKKAIGPVLNEQVFPPNVLLALTNYFKNPKASSCSDPTLYNVLRQFDDTGESISLSKINVGEEFVFKNKKYRKLEKRRTRSVCVEMSSGKKYLISEVAPVTK